jgi:kynureninase
MGDAAPFAFNPTYDPDPGVGKFLAGTPPILSMAALEAAIDLWLEVDREQVWKKSRSLSEIMIRLVDDNAAPYGTSIASPRNPLRRGSHLSIRHPHAYPVTRALIARGVIGDFRPPDIMRFSITPLYHRYVDIWDAIFTLVDILESRVYEDPQYVRQVKVT